VIEMPRDAPRYFVILKEHGHTDQCGDVNDKRVLKSCY
jgi:hypothetical protein